MSPDEQNPGRTADLAVPLRWVGRVGVVVVGLMFIVQGFRDSWSAAEAVAAGLAIAAVVIAVVFVVMLVLYFARRGRRDG